MSFKRYTRIFYMILMLLASGAGEAWADLAPGNITTEIKPNASGSIDISVSGREVTLTITPASGYYIKASDIVVEPLAGMERANAPERRVPGIANQITGTLYNDATERADENIINSVSGTSSAYYVFTLPEQYDGAYVTATFTAAAGEIRIPGNPVTYVANGHYILEDDIDGDDLAALFTGSQATTPFSGTFEGVAKADGTFPKITGMSHALFDQIDGGKVKNIIIEPGNNGITGTNHVGAIANDMTGTAVIYNCGVLAGSVFATNSTTDNPKSAYCCGGIVGFLDGSARVINCYSFANITGGNRVGGIVGYNNVATNANTNDNEHCLKTMVMNCMFYGDITGGNKVSPVYGGSIITNSGSTGLNTYNYYAYEKLKTKSINYHNCALAAKERNLTRYEYYRQLLNGNRKLAALYATGDATKGEGENSEMAKWVLDRDIAPYPILKKQGKYPSIINYDPERTYDEESGRMVSRSPYDSENNRNKGGTMGTLDVRISNVGDNAPAGARLVKYSLRLVRTDKDYDDYNFNYDKVQLPYYNDVGIGNYTGNKVVTGWKITSVTIGSGDDVATQGTFTAADEKNGYNFADRKTYAKDLYSESHRVFSQGAYFDVPYGATAITIEPYWGTAAYICDPNYDVVVAFNNNGNTGTNVTALGDQGNSLLASGQTIHTNITDALGDLSSTANSVYDNALVLVGNLHSYSAPPTVDKKFTIMSADLDKDNEPDYSFICTHYQRQTVSPIRFDFLNMPGMAMAQKPVDKDGKGATAFRNVSIYNPKGWFEVTNTCLVYFSQFECDNAGKTAAPVILLGGEYEQFVSTQKTNINANNYKDKTTYIHIGSNAYFKEFSNGTHSDGWYATKHIPVSATGGDYDSFYLSGGYRPDAQVVYDDNAEGYLSGGRFGEVAGAGQQQIDGDVYWQIYNADIKDFYGGGINDEKPITGNIVVDIFNSHVETYCGGPKFGNMQKKGTTRITYATNKGGTSTGYKDKNIDKDRTVTTTAKGCTFVNYYGAGYGGISYVRKRTEDQASTSWGSWQKDYTDYKGNYYDGKTTFIGQGEGTSDPQGGYGGPGVAVDFDYEFFVWSTGATGGRFYNKYASLSLASTNDVTSNLTNCIVEENFYGGGRLGKVDGNITSTLTGCTIRQNAFGAGYSASTPTVPYRNGGFETIPSVNTEAGVFVEGKKSTNIVNLVLVELGEDEDFADDTPAIVVNGNTGTIKTDVKLNTLGTVSGKATLNIEAGTTVTRNVYGGGQLSPAAGDTEVNINGGSMTDVYGGGDQGVVAGNVTVNIKGGTVSNDVYGGGALANTNIGNVTAGYGTANETIPNTTTKTTTVNLQGGTINGDAYGGGLGRKAATDVEPVEATVYGDITVNLGAADASVAATAFNITNYTTEGHTDVVKSGRLFGANNLNGSPKGDVTVNVYKTVAGNHSRTATAAYKKKEGDPDYAAPSYEVAAVYGGGNLADYTTTGKTAFVNIQTCNVSVESVYGGGNAAAVPGTEVTVNGAYEIQYVFGGGNGKDPYTLDNGQNWTENGGANVNGNANTMLAGGFIHEAYGASNEKGTISGTATLQAEDAGDPDCALDVWKMVGAGKNADINGNVNLVLGCMPKAKVDKLYGGADNANVFGNVTLTITSGNFGEVYGGCNLSGIITGQIILNIEETGCRPINIDNLYLGGNDAAYSVYGYYRDAADNNKLKPRNSLIDHTSTAIDAPSDPTSETQWYADPILNIRSFTRIGNVFGGGYGSGATIYGNPTVNINQALGKAYTGTAPNQTYTAAATELGTITNVYGGGEQAAVEGSTMVNIGTETTVDFETNPTHLGTYTKDPTTGKYKGITVSGVHITGDVFGGGKLANVTETTNVNICAKKGSDDTYSSVTPGSKGVTIGGDVFGGGQGEAAENGEGAFDCAKAMVGKEGTNNADKNDNSDYADQGTHVRIGNGTVTGNVYGGGEIARVEFHTNVMIGIGDGTGSATKSPIIGGSVFGAGKGENTHGYSGLVRGNSTVIIQGDAKVGECVYGGGEKASIGKYVVVENLPTTPEFGGNCTVTIQGYAEIGPDNMTMTATGGPVDLGHVFGAGKGVLPYEGVTGNPWSMQSNNTKLTYTSANQDDYFKFIKTLALASNTEVTIAGNAFVKGSVYGGSQNGRVQANTVVNIQGGQIGAGYDVAQGKSLAKYNEGVFIDPAETSITNALSTCATWTYAANGNGFTYDKYANETGYDSKGGAVIATDGHTFYGNVFGGGSGYFPYAPGKWYKDAGYVGGNTVVTITGGHILTNVYGGNEQTDVNGTCTVNMSGGTVGVPRTKTQIEALPVIGCIFGAGKGDKRTLFNTWTNVASTSVNITGGIIYGSVYGGGEDGHILGNAVTTVEEDQTNNKTITIGSTGDSGFDGNVFGGGRGAETSLTAGVVGGDVYLTIESGKIQGSVYGGGRLASVGTYLVDTKLANGSDNPNYGTLQDDDITAATYYTASDPEVIAGDKQVGDLKTAAVNSVHGHIYVNINGGHIGATNSNGSLITSTNSVGDVFGGGKGSTSNIRQFGLVKTTTVTMSGGQVNASVYGGGEVAIVDENTTVTINGGEVGDRITKKGGAKIGNVYGGGKGLTTHADAGLIKGNTKITVENGETTTPTIYHNIYGGGAYGSVGDITTGDATYVPGIASVEYMPISWEDNTGKAEVIITGGIIGQDGDENGMIFGSSRGDVTTPTGEPAIDPNDKLAWVHDTKVEIGTQGSATGPDIRGSVYGSGENGHVFEDTNVLIHSGKIGIDANTATYGTQSITDPATNTAYTGADYPKRGNVYGGGCGEDDYEISDVKYYNPMAGIVLGNTKVTVDGGKVVHHVYGGGALGSVGTKAIVEISGGQVGDDGNNDGNVYGASRGNLNVTQANIAQVAETEVQIKPNAIANQPEAIIWNDVFGGGEAGIVTGNVAVSVTGGEIKNDVYGGGALADTNTGNVTNYGTNSATISSTSNYTTTVNLTGGTIGNAYGGGLGRLGTGIPYTQQECDDWNNSTHITGWIDGNTALTENQANLVNAALGLSGNAAYTTGGHITSDHAAAYNSTLPGYRTTDDWSTHPSNGEGAIKAFVYGDVTVNVNEYNETTPHFSGTAKFPIESVNQTYNKKVRNAQNVEETVETTGLVYTKGRVFGCNNINGTPKGDVTVTVGRTMPLEGTDHIYTEDGGSYEMQAVYGGGNMANYEPVENKKTTVNIHGCGETSIQYVFGGGNAASVPETHVNIYGTFEIEAVFGGGNGNEPISYSGTTWVQSPGAAILGDTNVNLMAGLMHQAFGGSFEKGTIGGTTNLVKSGTGGEGCVLKITDVFGGGKDADVQEVNIVLSECNMNKLPGVEQSDVTQQIENVYAGSYNARILGNVTMTIQSGTFKNVFGGNYSGGFINGQITLHVEETSNCKPVKITNLYGGGNYAPYPGAGANNQNPKITINVKACTSIGNIYGGSYHADVNGDTEININMIKGWWAGKTYGTGNDAIVIPNTIGTIGNVYGGGDHGRVIGNTVVNIGNLTEIELVTTPEGDPNNNNQVPTHLVAKQNGKYDVLGANITGDVFGGGNQADVTGNTYVNICTKMSPVLDANDDPTGEYTYTHVDHSGTTNFEGISIGESVYGGGSAADVLSNTYVRMSGGYVFDGVYGGGLQGSVGTFERAALPSEHPTHAGCVGGKPETWTDGTGKCTVIISGGQIGPVEAAMADGGMKNTHRYFKDANDPSDIGPVDVGFVFGAGRGEVENPDDDPDADFHTYVKETEVIIKNKYATDYEGGVADSLNHIVTSPIIMASVYGGGENGRVRGNTLVKIFGGQIGCGEGQVDENGKPKPYTEAQWTGENASDFTECASWEYGEDTNGDGKKEYLPYDPLADKRYRDGTAVTNGSTTGSDGHTYYGCVFGGGSGYFPYEIKDTDGNVVAHDWLRSAGVVEGSTMVFISGGHILTCVFGGNELTSVTGDSCVVIMRGGTLGIPRTDADALKRPVTCYLFGGGKGDLRSHFDSWTNVKNTRVFVGATARIFGSVFGGAEDGHVSGNAKVQIYGGTIGTKGTSYVDGNVFGGGRGFSGTTLKAGTIAGNTEVNIASGNILGSVYGGGRLASVGVDFTSEQDPDKGQFTEDADGKTYGHVTVNISGGTIGNSDEDDVIAADGHTKGGNVFGSSMGRLTLLDDTPNELWTRLAQVKTASINITGGTIKSNVYGGSEFGTTRDNVYVTIGGSRNESTDVITASGTPTINGHVYGGGYGSIIDDASYISHIDAGDTKYLFTPMQYAGCVGSNTFVNVVGNAHVLKNVYGGGEMASVGVIDYSVTEDDYGDITYDDNKYKYVNVQKHGSHSSDGKEVLYDFGLSWPYKFEYLLGGKTNVNITGSAQVGVYDGGSIVSGGYVYGGGKGMVSFGNAGNGIDSINAQRYTEAHIANVRATEVTIGTSNVADNPTVRTVYGGGEDGHVIEDAKVIIHHGTIARSVFGGGKGEGHFTTTLRKATGTDQNPKWEDLPNQDAYSLTAGRVYGNTTVTMNGGSVGYFIYGGGNLGSVGKGNYSGGKDDYSTVGYGELPSSVTDNLWTAKTGFNPNAAITTGNMPTTMADFFLSSGKATVNILGGTVGTASGADDAGIPYGSVFGGSRGKAAASCKRSPRYRYVPNFFLGYVNKTIVNIGGTSANNPVTGEGPTIKGSVYGGGQDGHVRNSTEVYVYKGSVTGQTNDEFGRSGHVFGAGSGIGTYDTKDAQNNAVKAVNNSSGSVTCTTLVEVNGSNALIAGNVYGGGALASVGPPKTGGVNQTYDEKNTSSGDWKSYTYSQVNIKAGIIGGNVFAASRGAGEKYLNTEPKPYFDTDDGSYDATKYATDIWSNVHVSGGKIGYDANGDVVANGGNVYGGGETGHVKDGVTVNITGGEIAKDVYGGGALAHTNTSNLKQDRSDHNYWKWTDAEIKTAKYQTVVNLQGGTIHGDAYGGGLGRKEIGTVGQEGYVSPVEALVYGNVTVELNNGVSTNERGCVVSRIFGCNNLNGSPQGHVKVHVHATQPAGENKTIKASDKFAKFRKHSEYTTTNYSELTTLATTVGIDTEEAPFSTYLSTLSSGTDEEKKTALEKMIDAIGKKKYDVLAVYGGGNLAAYTPMGPDALPGTDTDINHITTDYLNTLESTEVVIEGCELTSIKQVYGGGNAASTPATNVTINGSYEIDESFGGGNGADNYTLKEGAVNVWYENPGANVGYRNYTHWETSGSSPGTEASPYNLAKDNTTAEQGGATDTKENRKNNYGYGTGVATSDIKGGRIHSVYGGSNEKGNISNTALSMYQGASECPMDIDDTYGASKNAKIDGQTDQRLRCAHGIKEMFGGAKNADIDNDVYITITNGSSLERVFGGNNTSGAINGTITVTIEEGGCEPIHIGELYAGGYLAPYSVYGYEKNSNGSYKTENVSYIDNDGTTKTLAQRIPLTSGTARRDPIINVISATYIGEIFGGGYQAKVVGNPHVNVNMTNGFVEVTKTEKTNSDPEGYSFVDNEDGKTYVYKDKVGNLYKKPANSSEINIGEVNEEDYRVTLPIGTIGSIYGGGNLADVIGDTFVEIGTGEWTNKDGKREMDGTIQLNGNDFTSTFTYDETSEKWTYLKTTTTNEPISGTIIPQEGEVPANPSEGTTINGTCPDDGITTNTTFKFISGQWTYVKTTTAPEEIEGTPTPSRNAATITDNVFGGGKGKADNYECDKAMVGEVNSDKGSTSVIIANGTVGTIEDGKLKAGTGNVYGGGKIGRVEANTEVTIGAEGVVTGNVFAPIIEGYVFGAGQGVATHGYSGLTRGHSTVTIQGQTKVRRSVYGGGEMATVGRFWVKNINDASFADRTNPKYAHVPTGMPYALMKGGECTVTVKDNAEIGTDNMKMLHLDNEDHVMTDEDGIPLPPDDWGHVFGAGKGVTPYENEDPDQHSPGRWYMNGSVYTFEPYNESNEEAYLGFIQTLALANNTNVTIGGNAFIKGSVYGGSENGRVLNDTHVTIQDNCQIGNGDGVNRRYTADEWAYDGSSEAKSLKECASWPYGKNIGTGQNPQWIYAPYDRLALTTEGHEEEYDAVDGDNHPISTRGGRHIASDGHTFYGNVFGGGSGLYPYKPGKWHRQSGSVGGNTVVDIIGGHILTSVYGGNELTDVGQYTKNTSNEPIVPVAGTGKCTINMTGGTLGVPRTLSQISAHPVTCYLFGAGKGDQRTFFNTWTNVRETEVNISGNARIFGSIFGGGEDGHVLGNVQLDVKSGKDIIVGTGDNAVTYRYPYIGTTGTSYVDGNIFGAGRGFSGDALTAGTVGGNVKVNISDGTMLGSVYGGGRLASVGTRFTAVTDPYYGQLQEDETTGDNPKTYGHITVNISGGTIGNDLEDITVGHTKGGNVFGGSMGRLKNLDDQTINPLWPKLGTVKTTKINISGDALIKSNVYGGGEYGMTRGDTYVTIGGILGDNNETITSTASDKPIIKRDVFGGGYGSDDFNTKTTITAGGFSQAEYTFTPMQLAGIVCGDSHVNIAGGHVQKNVYGGGELATVGLIDFYGAELHKDIRNAGTSDEIIYGFGLSWPYKLDFITHDGTNIGGTTNINITGGRLGITGKDFLGPFAPNGNPIVDGVELDPQDEGNKQKIKNARTDNGDVYGGSKGKAGDRYDMAFCGNVKATNITINYPSSNGAKPTNYNDTNTDDGSYKYDCIAGAVYGGGEDGHVIEDTHLTLKNGLIGHALYGGGSGKGKYEHTMNLIGGGTTQKKTYSLTAGKVYGNTHVKMEDGYVLRFVYGGGNMGSVGKGNYAGGPDDYYPAGYGETLTGDGNNLWTSSCVDATHDLEHPKLPLDTAYYFLSSGKTKVEILGGVVGYIDTEDPTESMKDGLPYGSVFGGSRGESAPNIEESPLYLYSPEFFSGCVNETEVIIGDATKINDTNYTGPTILGSVFGGGQDGNVRRDTHVKVNKGEIGLPFIDDPNDENKKYRKIFGKTESTTLEEELDNPQWLHRGNVYGAGSGIGKYIFDFNNDGAFTDTNGNGKYDEGEAVDDNDTYNGNPVKDVDYSASAGSVTRYTQVDINGGIIHRNVYGGGSLASVGPTKKEQDYDPYKPDQESITGKTANGPGQQSLCTVNIGGGTNVVTIGTPNDNEKGWTFNKIYGGEVYGASRGITTLDPDQFSTVFWTNVNIKNGATIMGNVYGGGDNGKVKMDTDVQIGAK